MRSLLVLMAISLSAAPQAARAGGVPSAGAGLAQGTTVPVQFEKTLDARKAKAGDRITARTLQAVRLVNGEELPRRALLVGHVSEAVPFVLVSRGYTDQTPSVLAVHFDRIESGTRLIAVHLALRAIAGPFAAAEAARPQYQNENDTRGESHLIGGVTFDPQAESIRDDDNRIIAFNRRDGVVARLQADDASARDNHSACEATDSEQAVGVFAPAACGVYGLDRIYLAGDGADGSGTFTLASRTRSVAIAAGSAALLQERSQTR